MNEWINKQMNDSLNDDVVRHNEWFPFWEKDWIG